MEKKIWTDAEMADRFALSFASNQEERREEFYAWLETRQQHAVEIAKTAWMATDETIQQAVNAAHADWEYDQAMLEARQSWYQ